MGEHLLREQGYVVPSSLRHELESAVLGLHVMPSMRALMTAGPALEKSLIAGYNCSYLPVSHTDAFHEVLYILMHGTGVGFSGEQQFTSAYH
jgi:ribonucleoside-diphosphate reductase alpha chain